MQQLVFYQNCFLHINTLHIPQNLGNKLVLKVLNAKLQQSSETCCLLRSLQYKCSNESLIFDNRDV